MTQLTPAYSHVEIRDALKKVLESKDFDTSDRIRRFLAYIVEETLAKRADRIKAYSIATSVFGRDERFDPQVDSIVRIEAGRLRRSLERYYLTSGANDPVRITIPRGSYVPEFTPTSTTQPGEGTVAPLHSMSAPSKLRIFVSAFEMESDHPGLTDVSRGLTRQIVVGLTRFQTVIVYCPTAALGGERPAGSGQAGSDVFDLILSGGISLTDHRLAVEALLTDARDGRLVWAETLARDICQSSAIETRDEIAGAIVRALAQPYGVLFAAQMDRSAESRHSGATLEAVAMFHVYKRTFDSEMYDTVRLALEDAIARDPMNAEAFACLSQVYSAAVRFRLAVRSPHLNPIQRALWLAHRAIEIAPRMTYAFYSLSVAQWFAQDVQGTFASLETALELNPNDTEIMAELGLRLVLRMDWDRGIAFLNEAYHRNPALPGTYRVGYALWHFVHRRPAEAYQEAQRINAPRVVYPHVLLAISAHAMGDKAATEAALRSLLAIDPDYVGVVATDLAKRNLPPELIDIVAEALRSAACVDPHIRRPGILSRKTRAETSARLP